MSGLSRRSLAGYAAERLIKGEPASAVAASLASAMVEAGLTKEVGFLLDDIKWQLEQQGALAIGKVTSAHSLSRELEARLSSQIKKAAGTREVALEKVIDKSVIGGVRIETSTRVWDKTIARQIAQLREAF